MPLLQAILILVIVGVVLWLINTYVPMQPAIKNVLNMFVVILIVLWLIGLFFPGLWGVRVPPK